MEGQEETTETVETQVQPDAAGMVPHSRFATVIAERNTLRDEAAAHTAGALELKATHTAALAGLQGQVDALTTAQGGSAAELATAQRHLMLSRDHGINDADVVGFLDYRHAQVKPAEGEQAPSFTDWLTAYKATDPAILRTNGAASKVAPKVNGGATDVPATEPSVDVARLSLDQYRSQRAELLKANRVGTGKG